MQAEAEPSETGRVVVPRAGAPLHLLAGDTSGQDWSDEVMRLLGLVDAINSSALLLIYRHHLTQAQTARYLGVSESEIKTRVAQGLRQLGRLLQQRGPDTA
jgi:DNA-directed RNA polymerase specialized sigma24 family protein